MQYVGDAVMAVFGAPDAERRPRRPGARRRDGDARRAGRGQRAVAGRRAAAVRPRHRPVDRRGRRRAARLGGAGRVHGRRRRGEPRASGCSSSPSRARPCSASRRGRRSPTRRRAPSSSTPQMVKGRDTPVAAVSHRPANEGAARDASTRHRCRDGSDGPTDHAARRPERGADRRRASRPRGVYRTFEQDTRPGPGACAAPTSTWRRASSSP